MGARDLLDDLRPVPDAEAAASDVAGDAVRGMFNPDQLAHMDALARVPYPERCWCGWGSAGRCDVHDPCPPDATLADRIATEAPCCGRPAARPDHPRTTASHYARCPGFDSSSFDLGGEG